MIWEWNGERVFINYMIMVDRNWSWKHWKQDSAVRRAWIVPDWNVNFNILALGNIFKNCLNCTRLECKYICRHRFSVYRQAWIVPDWNVNSSNVIDRSFLAHAWIVPDWNVNTNLREYLVPRWTAWIVPDWNVNVWMSVGSVAFFELELYQIGM